MRIVVRLALLLLLVGGGFVWGVFAHRNQVFPYSLFRSLGVRMGAEHRTPIVPDADDDQHLLALPYLDGTFDPRSEDRGVLRHEPDRVWGDYGFYCSREAEAAYLIDLEGRVVHEWSYPCGRWQHADLLPNGDVLVVVKDKRLLRLDRSSNHLWSSRHRYHHGTWVAPDGRIYALRRVPRSVASLHEGHEVLDDEIVILSPEGEELRSISVLDSLQRSPLAFLLPSVGDLTFPGRASKVPELDVLHTNHVEEIDGHLADRAPLYRKGNLLISIRNLNTIAVLDGETADVVWAWGPSNLTLQHQPVMLENGRILLFNNGTKSSSVLEMDPVTHRVHWRFAPDDRFFSKTRGSVQRLPNGNTLITESDRGYVHEVTPEMETVWRFANPEVVEGGKRMAIWRMTRFSREELPFLEELGR